MGHPVLHRRVHADLAEQLVHPLLILGLGTDEVVNLEAFAHDGAGVLPGVQGGEGVLEDHRDLGADWL